MRPQLNSGTLDRPIEMWRRDLAFVLLLCAACSRRSASPATTEALASTSTAPSSSLCHPSGNDLQAVRLDVDEGFIGSHDPSEILDPVWWSGDICNSVVDYERCLKPFSREQRLMYALLWYQYEVDNGGHDQFFFNSTGIVFPDALLALRELGLAEGVAILSEAGRRMGGTAARDRDERQRQLETIHPEFDDLDSKFYALDKTANLEATMIAYMRSHASAFRFHGTVQVPRASLEIRKRLTQIK